LGLAGRRPAGQPDPTANNFQGAVNTTLTNGDFGSDGTTGWVAEDNIALGTDSVTLNESPTRQTHLAQGFMVGATDRVLSFTVDAHDMARNTAGPNDAFEAALLNANTGLPVTNTVALSRSDALLNIQANGTERLANGVRKVLNTDGSATYLINLPAALAGTPVMLSFDLLGFGAAASHVTLRDVRLLGAQPIVNSDPALLDEDTAATGNLLLNDVTVGSSIAEVQLMNS
jgi:hypothetical protein